MEDDFKDDPEYNELRGEMYAEQQESYRRSDDREDDLFEERMNAARSWR